MSFSIQADGVWCECHVTDSEVCFSPAFRDVKVKIEDIIGCELVSTSWFFNRPALNLWHIVQKDDNVLMKEKIQITGEENIWRNLNKEIQDKLKKLTRRPKSLLVLINPIGGKKRGVKEFHNTVSPIFSLANIECDVFVSNKKKHMIDIMREYDTSRIDGVVVLGGDGSFAEVANVLLRKAQEEAGVDLNDPRAKVQRPKIPIAMIPTGSGNYVAGISTGCRDIVTSTLHVIKGNIFHINIFGVYSDDKLVDYAGAGVSYGLITEMAYLSDTKYRWLGHVRYYAIPLSYLLLNAAFKTYNAEVTCYIDETDTSAVNQAEKDIVKIGGRNIRHVTLTDRTKDSISFKGRFAGMISFCGNLLNTENNMIDYGHLYREPQNVFSTLFTNHNITSSKMFQQLKWTLNQEQTQGDDSFDTVNIRGLKVRVTDKVKGDGGDDDIVRHLIMVDGEICTIKNLDFQFWLHENIVPVFTSFRV